MSEDLIRARRLEDTRMLASRGLTEEQTRQLLDVDLMTMARLVRDTGAVFARLQTPGLYARVELELACRDAREDAIDPRTPLYKKGPLEW